jgi:hypothetical protein
MNDLDLEILRNMQNGATPPPFAVRMLEDVCERTGLSWKSRHVYLQKRKNKNGTEAWQAVLSIDGFRTVGARHPDYLGQEGPLWVTRADDSWSDIPPEATPYASKVGIRKRLSSDSSTTTWGVAKYKDYYAGMMWDKFPSTMIAKCAEMLAWRKTFPETFGGLYGDAELQQQEKTLPAKESLKAAELIGEVPVTPDKPAEEDLRLTYKLRLEDAKDGDEVKAIGREIQNDKRLAQLEVLELHQVYNKMKGKYA